MIEKYRYLYTMQVLLTTLTQGDDVSGFICVGVLSMSWNATQFMTNHKHFYIRGLDRHKEQDNRGKNPNEYINAII